MSAQPVERLPVEIWLEAEGDCNCPHPQPDGAYHCRHWWQCDWGPLDYGDPRPDRGEIGHLMLTVPQYVAELLDSGPVRWLRKGNRVDSVTTDGARTFMHLDWGGQHWTWELFDAYMRDRPGRELLIGRWPD